MQMIRKSGRLSKAENEKLSNDLISALDAAYMRASGFIGTLQGNKWKVSKRFINALEEMSVKSQSASTGFTNIVTCLSIKAARPKLDVRRHQAQIGAPFNFRRLSERVIYPWLFKNRFNGAKSGWQTRTFERPKPYVMTFDENIGAIKNAFLTCFDEVEEHGGDAAEALAYLIYRQRQLKQAHESLFSKVSFHDDIILDIVDKFHQHFNGIYTDHGASRLPVLAIHAVYQMIVKEVQRYSEGDLLPLNSHSAADARTGALGDIEVADSSGIVFEALEIKHGIQYDDHMVESTVRKLAGKGVRRYYMLTTHNNCRPDATMVGQLRDAYRRTGCQIIVDGVLPTIEYYLRLMVTPADILPLYTALLAGERAISHEHRVAWRSILGSSDDEVASSDCGR